VGTILAGSVRKAGNRLRITVQLTDVRNGFQLWSERYDRDLDDVFAIQDEIARAIVDKMRGQLTQTSISDILDQRSKRRTDDPDAYQAYLRGRFFWNQRTPGSLQQAIGHFQKAVTQQAEGLAHTWLSDAEPARLLQRAAALEGVSQGQERVRPGAADRRRAGRSARLARLLSADVRPRLGRQRAVAAPGHRARPVVCARAPVAGVGAAGAGSIRDALRSVRKAAELDPLSPVIGCHHAYALELLGRRGEAVEQLKTTLMLNPSFGLAHFHLGCLRLAEGISRTRCSRCAPPWTRRADASAWATWDRPWCGRTRRRGARGADAPRGRRKNTHTSPLDFALVYAGLGEQDQVFERLDRAFDERVATSSA
jgi:tetratricopeptide (TPR) repeat protein